MASDEKKNGSGRSETQQPTKKRRRKEVAIFGNYRHYYGYRVGQGLVEDPRLKVLKKEWFEGKDCLDIGCNDGSITIAIARKFGCCSILGVDIDGALVEDAYWNLRRSVNMDKHKKLPMNPKVVNATGTNSKTGCISKSQGEGSTEMVGEYSSVQRRDLLDIVSFQKENFVQSWRSPEGKSYHTILCLSVVKWIHLNWGDEGLITLFTKVWKLLPQGGIFILEPQPWVSYYKNRLISETAQTNYHDIRIRPEHFQEVLLDKIGFRMVENISADLSGSKSGFNRPILAFWK